MVAARSVYEVQLLDPSSDDTFYAWVLGILTIPFGPWGARARVRVVIVATDTGEPLADWTDQPAGAALLCAKIESDLDEMDAEEFVTEWGLPTPGPAG